MGRRVLVTGLASFWGGRVAKALELDPSVETIVGLDTREPTVELQRTEFVRSDESYSILTRIVRATQVDTILHTFLVVDSTEASPRRIHETNVIGTMNLLAAAGAPGSPVRHIVVKSSALVYGASPHDPTWFGEGATRSRPARTAVERSLLEAESYLADFAEDNPEVAVAVLRFANVLGSEIQTPISRALDLPVVPCVLGFDPLLQFVHEDDVVRAIDFVMQRGLSGVANVAADGRLPWSEVAALVGRRRWPLPPWGTGLVTGPLGRIGIVRLPPELLDLLRFGRGIDNRRLVDAGFRYRCTSAGTVAAFAEARRLHRSLGPTDPEYVYQPDVEAFFRHSTAVVKPPEPA